MRKGGEEKKHAAGSTPQHWGTSTCCMYTKKPKMETLQEYGWVTPRYTTFYVPRSTVQESLSNWTPPPGPSFWLGSVLGGSKLKTLNNNLQCTHIFTDKRTCFLTGTYVECSVFPSFSLYVTCFCQNH